MNRHHILSTLVALTIAMGLQATETADSLFLNFQNPAKEYYPRVWWHWMHGNVTRDGIRKDLEWMDRAGIAGFHQFNAQLAPTHVIVDKRIELFSPEWDEMFNYALDVADSLGLEVSIASSPGWSITGGPWVTMEDAQKKLSWRTMKVKGGRRIRTALPEPYEFSGPFQDKPMYPDDIYKYRYYKDIAVLALRTDGLTPADTVARWKNKAGFEIDWRVSSHSPATTAENAVTEVIDISDKVKDGRLDWKAPCGEWTIFRFGYNLLGKQNGPVEAAGKGLEADKLSREAMSRYFDNYLSIMDKASGHRLGSTIKYLMIDSYEAAKGTWTPNLPEEFRARRGYDLIPWLPVLTGIPVGSAEQSDNFLFDWRRTLGELIAENHYDLAGEILSQYGMGYHAESHEQATAFIGDGMMAKRNATIPMGAIWVNFNNGWYSSNPTAEADIHESASVAHIYGGNICAAESFSVNSRPTVKGHFPAYQCHPGNLKRLADAAMASGLNRFVMHCSPHQPRDDKFPGLGLGSFGNWFNRHDTWAEEARPWHDYLARSCYILQQGTYVADIAYLYSEDSNVTARFREQSVPIPQGYSYDFVNSDILINVLEPVDGKLVSPGGTSYSVLIIDSNMGPMTSTLRKRLEELRSAGIRITGENGDIGPDMEPDIIVSPEEGFSIPDFRFVHRRLPDKDIYFVTNISPEKHSFDISLRSSGGSVSLWDADGGKRRYVAAEIIDGRTVLHLDMTEDDAKFIVIEHKGNSPHTDETGSSVCSNEILLQGPWAVSFQAGREAPENLMLPELSSLSQHLSDSVRHFSGTARYSIDFQWDGRHSATVLDLGEVCWMAHVYLNGSDLGLAWHSPYRTELGDSLKEGINHLEIAVTNVWANKLIGDSSKPREERITYTPWQFYTPESELPRSGLIGPVKIILQN